MGSFTWIDGAVLAAYLLGTSIIAERLAGKRQTIRDFFLGGRRLPWWAVAGSIVAAEVSGVTFVSVPATAYRSDFTFMMLAVGSILARAIVAWRIVPAYYAQEIYSPYEYMGRRLGPQVDRLATLLFFVGSFLAQGARLFLAGMVLDVLTGMGVVWAIVAIGAVSVVWTWIGGINSVVWTDVVQFVVLFVGALIALVAVGLVVPGGWTEVLRAGAEAGKLKTLDLSFAADRAHTLWAGLFGFTFLTLASHGTDQNMAQRLFCCRSVSDARKAVVASAASQILPLIMLFVGLGIWGWYRGAGKTPSSVDLVLPLFILETMPAGLKGLLFAAIFSAATATSTLAAMAQTALTGLYKPLVRPDASEAHYLRVSRLFVVISAVGLCATAVLCIRLREQYPDILALALAMAGYTYGGLLGMLLLALMPGGRDARGLAWSVPLSMLLIFAFNWSHTPGGRWVVAVSLVLIAAGAALRLFREPRALSWIFLGAAAVAAVAWAGVTADKPGLAYPWHFPLGTAMTVLVGWGAGRARSLAPGPRSLVSSEP